MKWLLIVYLIILGVFDLYKKSVPILSIVLGGIGLLIYQGSVCWRDGYEFSELIRVEMGLLPGLILFVLSHISDSIGAADGLVVGIVGGCIGLSAVIVAIAIGFITLSVFGVSQILLHRATKQTKVPFIPFLAIGTIVAVSLL